MKRAQILLEIAPLIAIILIATAVFGASLMMPQLFKSRAESRISGSSAGSDEYLLTINEKSFIESSYNGKPVRDLIVESAVKKDSGSLNALLEATRDYLKIYDDRCVTVEVIYNNENIFWQKEPLSKGCVKAGTFSLVNPPYNIQQPIPTENPENNVLVVQKST